MSDEAARSAVEAAQAAAEMDARPRRRDLRPLARLTPFLLAHKWDAAAATFFLVFSTAATLGITAAARLLVDRGFAVGSADALNRQFLLLAAVVAVLAASTGLRFFFTTKAGERMVADLRIALYRRVLTLDPGYFLTIRTGEVLSRMTTDIAIVETLVASQVSVALRNLLTVIGALVLLVIVSPHLTGFVVILAVVVLAPLFLVGRLVRRLSADAQAKFADAVGYAGETLDGLDTVQAFGREASAGARFTAAVELAFRASVRRIAARAGMTSLVMLLVAGGIGVIMWWAAHAVFVNHSMTGGALIQFVILSVMAAGAVGALGESWGEVQKTAGAMERIAEILDAEPAIQAPPQPLPMPVPPRGEIAFDSVHFAYPGRADLPALNGFSLTVKAGERVALVGPSGAGKSTVFRLLLRFYDPQSGAVAIDGVTLTRADPAEIRSRIALVSQEAPLFSGSALENLRFGREDASVDDLKAAARAAEAEEFLSALPQGYDTPLGERGKTLSGGQRQRVAIARALVRHAPILLLDEATSALDAENEQLVQRALDDAMRGRTTLVIAHRLATVLKADRIIVMDEGKVVEEGKHPELLARGGLYARLARLQFGGEAA